MSPARLASSRGRWSILTELPGFSRPLTGLLALSFLGSFLGCDIPTEAPEWEQRWIVSGEETTIDVESLLPDEITLTPDGSAFAVSVDPISFARTLGDLCTDCQPLDGLFVPKPAFVSSLEESATLPPEVSEATVQTGQIQVVATNGFPFDMLRPAAGVTGTLTMTLYDQSSTGTLLDQIIVDGATESFGVGATLEETLEFSGVISGPLVVVVEVDSPAGDAVTINIASTLTVDASVPTLNLSAVQVDVLGQEFTMDDTDLDVEDLDETLVDHLMSGAIVFEIENPWGIGATMTLTIDTPFETITKPLTIPSGPESTVRVEFSQSELKAFLGQPNVFMGGSGMVSAAVGSVSVTPDQLLTLDAKMDLVVRIGGGEG